MSSFLAVLGWLVAYRYLIIFPLVILEGPIVMLVCGFLVQLGSFDFFLTYLLLLLGDLVGDAFWYLVGRYGARGLVSRFGTFFKISMADIERFEKIFQTHDTKILFVSKITMGFGFAFLTLTGAGAARISFKKYMAVNAIGGLVWTAFLMLVGYFFAGIYLSVSENLRLEFGALLVVGALTAIYLFGKFARKYFAEMI